MLNHIAAGIERNPSVNQNELIIFTYDLIEDGINNEYNEYENSYVPKNYMKNLKLNKEEEDLLSILDSFVSLLCKCLSSKYESIASAAIRCLSPLVRLHLHPLNPKETRLRLHCWLLPKVQ
ncbi:small subunit processome component 20 homolog [Olea europaea subsp. europaea]|uniref:Small subunit processome component 20 homolog n=1 Tax=Olea europaea subsp. europaea TaxID=158383 RepID=A0A8S0QCH1_OLEEU|nr:small subunit processome component 20 homolog [Olea europaea subsp. europaea]